MSGSDAVASLHTPPERLCFDARYYQLADCQAHNLCGWGFESLPRYHLCFTVYGSVAQPGRAIASKAIGCGFNSYLARHFVHLPEMNMFYRSLTEWLCSGLLIREAKASTWVRFPGDLPSYLSFIHGEWAGHPEDPCKILA